MRAGAGALSSGWVWLHLPALSALAACAREDARTGEPFRTLTADEGATMRAMAARIIPSDPELPGADEAGAAWFIDRALGDLCAPMLEPVRGGLAELDRRAVESGGTRFASLDEAAQDASVRAIETTPFFELARTLTVFGVFSHPKYGGGRDHVGERILGFTHEPAYSPPFGEYDAEVAGGSGRP